ncbi:MAG: hypothetical protein C0507_03250 [Cyanobacteria bacterium PR.3.49]|nr:hypothetical protein [Cyanobacteria bacterium PR.3.49]
MFGLALMLSSLALGLTFPQNSSGAPNGELSRQAGSAKKVQHSLRMRQVHFMRGEQIVLMCPKALKLISKAQGYKVVAKAPTWEVIGYRDDDKVLCRMSMDEFIRHSGPRSGRLPDSFKVVGERKIGPLKVKEYRQGAHEVWLAAESKIPQAVYDILSAYNKCGLLSSIIIRVVSEDEVESVKLGVRKKEMQPVIMIDTKNAEMVPYKDSDYELPRGYREVFGWEKFMVSTKSRDSAFEIFSEMGLGEKFGKQGK